MLRYLIARHSEIPTLNFRDNRSLPDWRDTYYYFFLSVKSKSSVYFRRPNSETPDNSESFFLPDHRSFPVLGDENEHRIWNLQDRIHKLKEKIPFIDDVKLK